MSRNIKLFSYIVACAVCTALGFFCKTPGTIDSEATQDLFANAYGMRGQDFLILSNFPKGIDKGGCFHI